MRMNIRFWCLSLAVLMAFVGCKRSGDTAKAKSEAVEEVRELTPQQRVTFQAAQIAVSTAFDKSSSDAIRKIESDLRNRPKTPPKELAKDGARRFTLFFASNNRGEREDCGCRKNPLGGLARRHTMLEALTDEKNASEIWGDAGLAQGPVFHVDAGDSLFRAATLNRAAPSAKKIARIDAETIVEALNTFPPDVMLAGELEFALGLDELQAVAKKAKFPIISANVKTEDGEAVFPGSVVVERDGIELGVVGVTKSSTRLHDYWSSRGLAVEEPVAAAKRELGTLSGDLDFVLLLSNLGMKDTADLVKQLRADDVRVDMVVVSGTNRLTTDPEFTAGVPLVEPLSRGKYVGRADLLLNGDEVAFRNAAGLNATTLRDYRRALRSYWTTRTQLARHRKQVAQLEVGGVEGAKKAKGAKGGKKAKGAKGGKKAKGAKAQKGAKASKTSKAKSGAAQLDERRREAIETRQNRVKRIESRLAAVSEALRGAAGRLAQPKQDGGDDWIVSVVAPVKIDITEEPSTRRVVERFKKRRPTPKKGRGLPPSALGPPRPPAKRAE
jgi:hypothetical protein